MNTAYALQPDFKARSYIAYDQYAMMNAHGQYQWFIDDGVPLADFKKANTMVVRADMATVVEKIPLLPGETDPCQRYDIATAKSKKVARSLLKILREIEIEGACLSMFDDTNIVISPSGKVKLRRVSICRNLSPSELTTGLMWNYKSAADIIEGLFGGMVPPDMDHLLFLLRNQFEDRELFPVHAALVPLVTYPALYKEIYDLTRFVLPKQALCKILSHLSTVPNFDQWKSVVQSNLLLAITLNYRKGSYTVPADMPNQVELNDKQLKALAQLGLVPDPNQGTSLTPEQIALIVALNFYEFMRNRIAHRMEPFEDWAQKNLFFTAQGSDLVTRVRFPLALPYVQMVLLRLGVLYAGKLDKFF